MALGRSSFHLAQSLLLALTIAAAMPSPASEPPPDPVVEWTIRAVGDAPARVRLIASAEELERSLEVSLHGGLAEGEIRLDPEREWRLRAVADGYWSSSAAIEPESGERVEVDLWPASELHGRLEAGVETESIATVHLRLTPASVADRGGDTLPEPLPEPLYAECSAIDGDLTSCVVPAGRWNMAVSTPGFAPRYFWNLDLRAGEALSLGRVRFREGGSVFGAVVADDGDGAAGARVLLRPAADRGRLRPQEAAELRQLSSEIFANEDGLFQIVGVAPGVYEIVAERSDLSEARRSPIVVSDEEWTELTSPLRLNPPLSLSVEVSPPVDAWGERWTLGVLRRKGQNRLETLSIGRAREDGSWASPPIAPGPLWVEIETSRGDRLGLHAFELSRSSQYLPIELSLFRIEGEVTLGGRPLEADLWFGGERGATRIELRSDSRGDFSGVLPHAGDWRVDARAEEPPVVSRGLEVVVEPSEGASPSFLRIEVPDTLVGGVAVDEQGQPVEGARITVSPRDDEAVGAESLAGADGGFELVGLEEGPYSVEARTESSSADAAAIDVNEGAEAFVRLVLRPRRTAVGIVSSGGRPLAQAHVVGYPLSWDGDVLTASLPNTRSGVDGRFELRLPGTANRLRVVTMAPGHVLDLREVEDGTELRIALEPGRGGVLQVGSEPGAGGAASRLPLVMVNGLALDVPRLQMWARLQGAVGVADRERLIVPGMPPGSYALCWLEPPEAILVIAGAAVPALDACDSGFLTAGGELALGRSRPL